MVNVENKPEKITSTMKLEQLLDLNHKLHAPQMTEWGPCLTQLQQKASQPDGFTPAEARAIYRLLARCLLRPMGGKMRGKVRHLLQMMSANHSPDLLVASLSETFGFLRTLPPPHHHGRMALEAFTWSFHVIQGSVDPPASLISLQAQLLTAIAAADKSDFLKTTASSRLQVIVRNPNLIDFYLKILSQSEPSHESLVLWSFIVKLLSESKQLASFLTNDLKKILLDHFTKITLASKTGLPSHILICTKPIIKTFNHDQFRQTLMPLINKALLRNPELIMETFGFILESVSLDLSQYASEFGHLLKNHIGSKDEKCQNEAIVACKHLAMQCSNGEAIQELLTLFFDVLNGAFGKLTISSQRLGVLTAIGNLSYNIVVGASTIDKLCEYVCHNLIMVLKQEVHEGILVTTLKQLSLWGCKFSSGLPPFVLEWFKTGFTLKTSTSLVRCSYLQCIHSSVLKNQVSTSLQILMPHLTKTIEALFTSSINTNLITEGLLASCILIKLDLTPDSLIKKICDVGKNPIFTEKYLTSATQDNLKTVLILIESLLLDHFDSLTPDSKPIIKAFVELMLHSNVNIRKPAHSLVTKVGNIFSPELFIHPLIDEIKILVFSNDNAQPSRINSQALQNSLFVLSVAKSDLTQEESATIAKNMFLIVHHHLVGSWKICRFVWAKILKHLNLDEFDLFTEHQLEFHHLVTDFEGPIDVPRKNALRTLIETCSESYIPSLMEFVLDHLKDPAFLEVTKVDYEIFKTPEGEVYDKSVYESYKEVDQFKNMKRESKLYSYKEQLAEIELKKELEAKRKAQNPGKPPELTKKQQELKAAQLEKEALIRSRVKKLEGKLIKYVSLLKSIFGDSPLQEEKAIKKLKCLFLTQILDILVALIENPLSAHMVLDMLTHLGIFVTEKPVKGAQIAQLIFRVSNSAFEPDPAWVFPDLGSSIMTLLAYIGGQAYTPPFTLCFPLLKWMLLNFHVSDERKLTCLKLMQDHSSPEKFESSCDPLIDAKLLPFLNMIDVLIKVINKDSSIVKTLAKKVILQVISLSTAPDNKTLINFDEVYILLEALKSENAEVRSVALECLSLLIGNLSSFYFEYEQLIMKRFWIARFDVEEANTQLAKSLWKESRLRINDELCLSLLDDIASPLEFLRLSTAAALAEALSSFPHQVHPATIQLMAIYREHKYVAPILLDNFNRVIAEPPPDKWEPRSGVAKAFYEIAPLLTESIVKELMSFFLSDGLGDTSENVRKDMLDSAVKIIDTHGKENINILLPMLEDFLSETPETSAYDDVRQGVVILMGTLAHHLEKTDPKIKPIISKLVQTLSTPSQQVQEAVANCLPPLVSAIKDDAPKHVKKLLDVLLESQKYGEKRGAAYGLAGFVKGLGILSLKQLNVIDILVQAIQNKKDPKQREGALLAFEMLCNMLGRLFEPYIVHVLPNLLICFGDHDRDVRRATDETAKAVMSKLSAHGVKLVLPSLLAALEEESWRTKASSVELLGAMAFCAPKQLSSCLPNIVPKLIEVLSDSHPKVQKAGAQALKLIGSVIRNPEIQAIVPVLLEALQDPSKKTSACLTNLLNTKFVHFIDAPSLALIMPVVHRAFQDRSTETRKMAAQIIGNMYSLTDQKDLEPYLPTILPGLKQSLLDPVPEVRTVSARALGTMAKGMGETSLVELKPWLMTTLTSETSSVDRSGAAQGLSEVLGGLGIEKLHAIMPEFISRAERTDIQPHVKDGYIMMFKYLPMVFNKEFTPFIGPITKPILKALADENEYVRDTALKAGQSIVNMYAETSIELLLPELEKGLFDDNWRIRYSSIQLLGDLLYKISGVSGKMSTESADDDDNFGTEQSQKAILRALGTQRHQRVLAGLYMGRSDVALMVRQAALHVWKVVVSNTPRTLREILPTLFSLLLGCLASNSHDKRQIAAKTLGDLVRKLGERVLPEIIPILEKGLDSQEPDQRQGVCIGLSEIMSSTSKEMVLTFFDSLVPTVRRALSDELPEVRKAAAKTFDSLHSNVGVRALDEILPPLLEQLNDPENSENTLDGLKQVMAIKSKVVLPYLVPQLTSPPVNTKALALLSTVAGDALTKYLNKLLPALLTALGEVQGSPSESHELEYCQAVVMSVTGEQGVRTIIDFLLEASRHESLAEKKAAVALLSAFCSQSKADLSSYVPQLFRGLIHLYTYDDKEILQNSYEALNAITKTLDPVAQLQHVSDVRQAVRFAVSDLKGQELLPGFCQPKGIMPILPIFREAILNGTPESKEQASHGLGEVIKLTNAVALKPSVVNITGPLIRILGDRFTWNVKVAVLETLALLLNKVGIHLKPFLPQLQGTFLKSLSDPNRTVRLRAAAAFSHLISIQSKSEPIFVELHSAIKSVEDVQIKETNIYALRCIIREAGDKMPEGTRNGIVMTLTSHLACSDESLRQVAASCLGTIARCLPSTELLNLAQEYMIDDDPTADWVLRHAKSIALMVALKEAPARLCVDLYDHIVQTLLSFLGADRLPITLSGVRATTYFFVYSINTGQPLPSALIQTYSKSMNHSCNEVKQVLAQGVSFLARACSPPLPSPLLKSILPQLVNGTKEKNSMVRANSEFALVAILGLREGHDVQPFLSLLDPGAREALADVIQKVLRKVAAQPLPKEEEFDCTLLT